MSGNYSIIGTLELGTALEIRGYNDNTIGSDIYLYDDGLLSSEDNMIFMIDSDSGSSDAKFIWKKDTEVDPGGSTLMVLEESGSLTIGTGNLTIGTDSYLATASGRLDLKPANGRVALFGNSATYYMDMFDNASQNVHIDTSGDTYFIGGNVGIGTDSPSQLLDIEGTGASVEINATSGNSNIYFYSNAGLVASIEADTGDDLYITANNAAGVMYFRTGGANTRLTILANGNISMAGTLTIGSSGTLQYNQSSPSGTTVLGYNGYFYATRVYNAVYNDLAEFMLYDKTYTPVPGMVMVQKDGLLHMSNRRADKAAIGVYSDTYGFALGADKQEDKVPIGLAGKVKTLVCGKIQEGDELVSYEGGRAVKANIFERLFKRNCIIGKSLENGKNEKVWVLIK